MAWTQQKFSNTDVQSNVAVKDQEGDGLNIQEAIIILLFLWCCSQAGLLRWGPVALKTKNVKGECMWSDYRGANLPFIQQTQIKTNKVSKWFAKPAISLDPGLGIKYTEMLPAEVVHFYLLESHMDS